MITDPKRLTDGFRGLPDGMDGSRLPPLVPPTSVYYAENVTFRDGIGAKTRPGFMEIPPSFWRPIIKGDGSTETLDSSVGDTQVINGQNTSSASRYITFVKNGKYYQGSFFFQDPRIGNPAQIILVIDGLIISLNFAERSVFVWNHADPMRSTLPVYMTQAERFLIIQNGLDTPRIFDGYALSLATDYGDNINVVPVGKQMVYGQGRLFVATTDGAQVVAGDLVYGGSLTTASLLTASFDTAETPGYIKIKTTAVHRFSEGDTVTITGMTSSTILNGTYTIFSVLSPTEFTIPSNIANPVIVSASIIGPLCVLSGVGIKATAGSSIKLSSSDTDQINQALGTFTALVVGTDYVSFEVPTKTATPTISGTSCTLTGSDFTFVEGQVVTVYGSDTQTGNAANAFGKFTITSASATSITYTIPDQTATPTGTIYIGTPVPTGILTLDYAGSGSGGTIARANVGYDSDLLNFTETTFIAEGGNFLLPANLGQVQTMNFVPLQDTATGQGDLVVLCTRGAASFAVSLPRTDWKTTTGFQRVLYSNIGATSDSTVIVNGDLFFRSLEGNGIRSYRSARAEFGGYGQTPLSAEIDPILLQDTSWLLGNISFAYFNDRLLMTCWPYQVPPVATDAIQAEALTQIPLPIMHRGIAVLDFHSVASGHSTYKPAFDGVWTGLNVLKILSGTDADRKRAFLVTLSPDAALGSSGIGIWEIIEGVECDQGYGVPPTPISSQLVTRAYNFNGVMTLKKLLRLDLWFDSISGGPNRSMTSTVYYKPDDWPNWVTWASVTKNFSTESSTMPVNLLPEGYSPQLRLPAPTPPYGATDSNANTMSAKPMPLGYDFNFKITWSGHARLGRLLIHGLEITEPVGGASL